VRHAILRRHGPTTIGVWPGRFAQPSIVVSLEGNMLRRRWGSPLLLALLLTILAAGVASAGPTAAAAPPDSALSWSLLNGALAFLVPVGFLLVAAGGLPAEEARQATLAGLAALSLATLGYWACGFALQFGGVGLIARDGGLQGLIWEWSALDVRWGTGWGMAGLHGFGLTGAASTPGALSLFFAQLPWITTATLVPLLALRGRAPTLVSALGGLLVGALLYPLVGNWVWGGGWLANLGLNLGLGHGFVDFAGSGSVHLLGAAVAWAGILTFLPRRPPGVASEPVALPPVHLPLLATLGGSLLLVGGVAWAWANPLLDWAALDPSRVMVNLALAAAAGAFVPLAYTWLVANRPDPLMAARGLAAAIVAVSGSMAFVPPWAALAIGGVSGLLTPLTRYLVDHLLRWNDPTAALTVHGLAGLWGLLAAALFADGTLGAGWNGIGSGEYLHVAGQGVSGLWTAAGLQPDWPGQLQAQAVGLAAIGLFAFLVASVVFGPLAGLTRLVQKRSALLPASRRARADEAEEPEPEQEPLQPPDSDQSESSPSNEAADAGDAEPVAPGTRLDAETDTVEDPPEPEAVE
jgi:Amt family ammonium transporter